MHDEFAWWAEIWIPGATGALTLVVSIVALWVSRQSSKLAHAVESQRVAAEVAREADASRARLQAMAIDEARALQRWVTEELRTRWHERFVARRIGDPVPPRHPSEQARIDAEVALTQSIVPGAEDLLRITAFDVQNRNEFLPPSSDSDEVEAARDVIRERLRQDRDERTRTRIRSWALDPEAATPRLKDEVDEIVPSEAAYMLMGLSEDFLRSDG